MTEKHSGRTWHAEIRTTARTHRAEAGVAIKRNNRWYPKFHRIQWRLDQRSERPVLPRAVGVFYQLHPLWHPVRVRCIGATSPSTDMVNWKREPIMFAPSLEEERTASSLAPQ